MAGGPSIVFHPFRLDPVDERLWRGKEPLPLRPKSFQVLHYLVREQGRLVSKQELLRAVWPGVHVGDGGLRVCIREIREALQDNAEKPRFIETAVRRGWRFIGKISHQRSAVSHQQETGFIGREAELTDLQGWLDKALQGERQVVFVAGEPGIGKTTLVEAFLEQAGAGGDLWIGRGQCLEQYGAGEAYMPVLEALAQLCREAGGGHLIAILRKYAPMWLVQMPWLVEQSELETLQRQVHGATRERMLREIVGAVEAVTAERPLVLVLEDLHWSDYSTAELLSYLAQKRKEARLMVIGTYRPDELIIRQHPLRGIKDELRVHRRCEELWLGPLTEREVDDYVAARFGRGRLPPELAACIYKRTDGNPLFMVNMTEYLVRQGVIVAEEGGWKLEGGLEAAERSIPDTLREMIQKQVERLGEVERGMLEVASVAGGNFCAAAVAAGLKTTVETVEATCEELARRGQFLRSNGVEEWPDGTAAECYSFIHALYQSMLYDGVPEARRVRLHRAIGEREEEGYGERTGEIAAELAMHFEWGRDYRRAVRYLGLAGENDLRRHAYREAVNHLTKALALLKTLQETPERSQQELQLQIAFGASLIAIKGYADPEVGTAYARARELCRQAGNTPELFPALWGLCAFYLVRAELQTARELGEQCFSLAQAAQDPALLLPARDALGASLFWQGKFAEARVHDEKGITLYDPKQHHSLVSLYGFDRGVVYLSSTARHLHMLGYPDQAIKKNEEALALARELAHPYSLAIALNFAAMLHQFRGEGQATEKQVEAAMALSADQGFLLWAAFANVLKGWALTKAGKKEKGIAQMRQGLAAFTATGAELTRPYFLALLAEAYGKTGATERGLMLLAEARTLVDKTGERFYEAELYRLNGELLRQKAKDKRRKAKIEAEVEAYFRKAIEVAGRQGAKSLELRAAVSLSRLLQKRGDKETARQVLAETYGWFTEGFDTLDLREAKALLQELV